MRVLTVHPGPHFSVADVWAGWSKGLRQAGCEVAEFNLHDRLNFYEQALVDKPPPVRAFTTEQAIQMAAKSLHAVCWEFGPQVVVVVSSFYVPPLTLDLMRERGHKVVVVHTESPYEDDRQAELAVHADLNIVNDPTNLHMFPAGTVYVPHAYDPDIHRPQPVDPGLASEFCFVGTGYPSRVEFFERVDWSGIDVTLAGNWQHLSESSPLRRFVAHPLEHCIDNGDAARLYASTKASVNLYRRESSTPALGSGWAMGPREVELAACGTFFLRDPRPESDLVLPMLPSFTGPADFGERLRWWLDRPAERIAASREARAAVADRTFEANARRLLAELETFRPSRAA